jgi:electron transfer flavoprotein alpha subunit
MERPGNEINESTGEKHMKTRRNLSCKVMLARSIVCRRALVRAYATSPSPHALVLLEHRQGVVDSGSLSALTAAAQLGGQVTGLVVGGPDQVQGVVETAKK